MQEIERRHHACQPVWFNLNDDRTICNNSVLAARIPREKRSTGFRRCRTSTSTAIIEFRANLFARGRDLLCARPCLLLRLFRISRTPTVSIRSDHFESISPAQFASLSLSRRSFRPRSPPLSSSFRVPERKWNESKRKRPLKLERFVKKEYSSIKLLESK